MKNKKSINIFKRAAFVILSAVMLSSFVPLLCAGAADVTINVYNWGEYIDQNLLTQFEEENPGIKVNYTTFDSNESMYSKIISGAANYDIVVPSDYMISKMINEDLLAELDFDNIPNYKYIGDVYKNLAFDPDNKYSVPYFWGTTVIMYNSKYVSEDDVKDKSVNLLWNEKYSGKILMFDNPRDAFGIALKKLGYSMNSSNPSEWDEAAEELKRQKPLVQAYVMDAIFDKMESEEAYIAPYYAGDALTISDENPDIKFYIPVDGSNMFFDSMCILKSSEHKTEAEKFINFMCDPQVSAVNSEEVGYATANTEALNYLDPELTENKLIYPESDFLKNYTEVFKNLPAPIQAVESQLWTNLKIESSTDGGETARGAGWIQIFCVVSLVLIVLFVILRGISNQRKKKLWRKPADGKKEV